MSDINYSRGLLKLVILPLGVLLLGFVGGWAAQTSGLGRGATENTVREYILAHPEILPEAMDRLREREQMKRLAPVRDQVKTPFPGAILGNPKGSVTLVEFSDYACGFCRQSVEEVNALIAANRDLKVVMREFPILSQESVDAARMSLAAAEQGKYTVFHQAMFEAGRPSAQTIAAAAAKAGLDMERARKVAASPAVETELSRNMAIAEQLGLNGTPSWVIGNEAVSGALGRDELTKAIARARKPQPKA